MPNALAHPAASPVDVRAYNVEHPQIVGKFGTPKEWLKTTTGNFVATFLSYFVPRLYGCAFALLYRAELIKTLIANEGSGVREPRE